MVILISMYRL
ncbi:hypothetical protein F383_24677 [Gossypium arboreum]|uniref:Uncharacterized protein n=1 Tax=Gossypium arboreum TaxID=29729 RepID=A0A0B0P4Z8_GOSAR|nr:hypothetical protein F383_24677 [Gossypium arboreum]